MVWVLTAERKDGSGASLLAVLSREPGETRMEAELVEFLDKIWGGRVPKGERERWELMVEQKEVV